MTMNLERAAMRGRLAEVEQNETRLTMRIEAAARAMKQGLNTALTPVEELAIPELDTIWDDLKLAWSELVRTQLEKSRLLRELK